MLLWLSDRRDISVVEFPGKRMTLENPQVIEFLNSCKFCKKDNVVCQICQISFITIHLIHPQRLYQLQLLFDKRFSYPRGFRTSLLKYWPLRIKPLVTVFKCIWIASGVKVNTLSIFSLWTHPGWADTNIVWAIGGQDWQCSWQQKEQTKSRKRNEKPQRKKKISVLK